MYVHVHGIVHFTVLQLYSLKLRIQYTGKYLRPPGPAGQDAEFVQGSCCVMCAIKDTSDLAEGAQQHAV